MNCGFRAILVLVATIIVAASAGCGGDDDDPRDIEGALSGRIDLDGSSTVAPFATRAAERFLDDHPGVAIIVSLLPSRTQGGFERFCAGETDLSSASRPIEVEERRACRQGAIEYVELQVANDALTVVVNPQNDWADCLTLNELKKIWEPGSSVDTWREVRPGFPDEELELFGPGSNAGTFDYFTEAVVGGAAGSRTDYVASDDDDVSVERVARARGGLGYFGLTHFSQNEDKLKALEIDGGSGCVAPTVEASQHGDYEPLSRPLFIYVSRQSLQKPAVRAFVEYVIANAQTIAEEALLVPLTDEQLEREQTEFDRVAEETGTRE
jgi:phosphate transport system substrate-binding protein